MDPRRNTQCNVCQRLFAGIRGLNIHRSRVLACRNAQAVQQAVVQEQAQEQEQEQEQVQQGNHVMPLGNNILGNEAIPPNIPAGNEGQLVNIEGYSLNYVTIPPNLFPNLENEQVINGRYASLQEFANNETAKQRRILFRIKIGFFILLHWCLTILLAGSKLCFYGALAKALYFCYIGESITVVNNFIMAANN